MLLEISNTKVFFKFTKKESIARSLLRMQFTAYDSVYNPYSKVYTQENVPFYTEYKEGSHTIFEMDFGFLSRALRIILPTVNSVTREFSAKYPKKFSLQKRSGYREVWKRVPFLHGYQHDGLKFLDQYHFQSYAGLLPVDPGTLFPRRAMFVVNKNWDTDRFTLWLSHIFGMPTLVIASSMVEAQRLALLTTEYLPMDRVGIYAGPHNDFARSITYTTKKAILKDPTRFRKKIGLVVLQHADSIGPALASAIKYDISPMVIYGWAYDYKSDTSPALRSESVVGPVVYEA